MNIRALVLIGCLNLAQLPIAMRPLLVTLTGVEATGSFAAAGLAGAAAAVGTAIAAPLWARTLPSSGDRRVLVLSGTVFTAAQLALAAADGPALFTGLAAASGLVTPPVSASVRAMLPRLAKSHLTRAYAVNSVALETVYIGGPLWVSGWAALAGPAAALVATTLTGAAGLAVGVALVPAFPRSRPRRGRLLNDPAVHTLGAAYLAYWVCMGAMWVLVPAFAEHAGAAGQSGLLVAVWSAGSLAGGLALAVRPPRAAQRTSYTLLLGALALTSLPLALPGTIAAMAVVIAVFGLALAPWLAVHDQLVAATADDRSGELYGWLTTLGQVGSAAGSAMAGPVGDRYGGGPAFLLVSAALVIAAGIAVTRRRTLPGA
ncbi:MFS transporter [Amycolatopsis thermalba]|uniref:MFS transporter n=1 Tax=Amycolatopsis thermalba TaxID=944492 RepID=UPI000E272A6B|nr:MFS transporter [Amycolatopsis thermalba]